MKICIDAGHNFSEFDTGASGNGLREQDVTFLISQKLNYLLKDTDIGVVCTRPFLEKILGRDTVTSSLKARCDISNYNNCDLFISIHCNSAENPDATGTETYIMAEGGMAEVLANKVHNKIVERFGLADRGVIANPTLYVLRKTDAPAMLIETAFLSNKNDAYLLAHKFNDFAIAIYEGICEYLEIEPVATRKPYTEPKDIVFQLSKLIEINEVEKAVKEVKKAKEENSSLYWILYKLINKGMMPNADN